MGRSQSLCPVLDMPLPRVAEEARLRAFERLYLRREAVDELIRSLETYQDLAEHRAPCVPISAARKCS